MEAPTSGCSNSQFYNDNMDAIKNGSMQYVAFNASTTKNKIYIDDALVKDSGKINEYSYFAISNMERATTVVRSKTLKPTEKVVLTIDVSDKNIKTNNFKDLRLTIKYGATSNDVALDYINSISYYLVTKNKSYGPFKLDEANYVNTYQEQSTDSNNKTTSSPAVGQKLVRLSSSLFRWSNYGRYRMACLCTGFCGSVFSSQRNILPQRHY